MTAPIDLTGPACSVCLHPLDADRDVPWCGQACRGLHRAIEKHRAGGDHAKRAELARARDEKADAAAVELGYRDRFALGEARAWQKHTAQPPSPTMLANREHRAKALDPDHTLGDLDDLEAELTT